MESNYIESLKNKLESSEISEQDLSIEESIEIKKSYIQDINKLNGKLREIKAEIRSTINSMKNN